MQYHQIEDRWRIRGGPNAQYRIGPLLFLPTTPPPRSSPVLQFHQLEDCWRTREGPQDQQRISPPLFLPTTPPSRSSLVLQDRWRTREGPQDQHRIGPPLFLPITPPPWSSPVLQHHQLEDRWTPSPILSVSSSPVHLMHMYKILLQNSLFLIIHSYYQHNE